MERLFLYKKQIIAALLFIGLVCFLGFNLSWGLFVIFPILLAADICYIFFPLSIIAMIVLSVVSWVKHDYEIYGGIYKLIAVMVAVGFIDMFYEKTVTVGYYADKFVLIWNILLMLYLISSIMFISRKNDTRLYTFIFLPVVLLCLFRDFVNVAG